MPAGPGPLLRAYARAHRAYHDREQATAAIAPGVERFTGATPPPDVDAAIEAQWLRTLLADETRGGEATVTVPSAHLKHIAQLLETLARRVAQAP